MRRSTFLAWHRRIALLFAPLLILQALTGAVLLFRAPLDRLIAGPPAAGPVLPAERLVVAASASGKWVERLWMPAAQGDLARVQLADAAGARSLAAIDPVSGRIRREGGLAAFPAEAALQLHYRLMAGTTGLMIVAMTGLVLLAMAATGLAYWWPRNGHWAKALAINPRLPSRIRLRHWHRSIGVVAAVLITVSAATGLLMAGADLAAAIAPGKALPARAGRHSPAEAEVRRAMALAKAAFPKARVRDLRFSPGGMMDANLLAPERNALAVHIVKVDLAQGRIVRTIRAQDNPALWMKVLPYHAGDAFGITGRLVLLIEALVLVGLGISGPVMWWQQGKRSK
ncbi:MAG: PepSY-associated TM helix domain-containing protein [Novosphingobium meiothermophilum]|uniref:PepSY-associated TM helix domain-containing protein n=1 Tax=Novosphingobium TaxID=165696 RepID=UPI000D6E7621|nr:MULTISPECIES: PepSY-associated TM helix domain-containing protein [Novosphingobium]